LNKTLAFASVDSPKTSSKWVNASLAERMAMARQVIERSDTFASIVVLSEANVDGQLVVQLLTPMGPEKRGTILLDLEKELKDSVDQGLTVWLEPLGDKSSLRNLRGIEVKKVRIIT
jgi:hypothetical protein